MDQDDQTMRQGNRDFQSARLAASGTGSPYPNSLEHQVGFVLIFSIVALMVIALLSNGDGAGSQHHRFVQYVLGGLFVAGSGVLGMIVANAACGRLGLNGSSQPTGPGATIKVTQSSLTVANDPHVTRQTDLYRRRVFNETVTTEPTSVVTTRPAPPAIVETSESEAFEGDNPVNPSPAFRRRRPRRS